MKSKSENILASMFQFHYGTIKSTMPMLFTETDIRFNSTMVRLKGVCAPYVFSAFSLFQFHYGTIKRVVEECLLALIACFNSTMVRLKGGRCGATPTAWFCSFNSTMVRLKGAVVPIPTLPEGCFNSTMVRLKGHGSTTLSPVFFVSIPLWYD